MTKPDPPHPPWSLLPDTLLERSLAYLPLASLARLRLVCTKWNSLICSLPFHHLSSQLRPRHLWFIHRHRYHQLFFDPLASAGGFPNLAWPPAIASRWRERRVLGAHGGLVLFVCDHFMMDRTQTILGVWNPLTRSHRMLPLCNPALCIFQHGFHYNSASSSYKILVSGLSYPSSLLVTEAYDSLTNLWTTCSVKNLLCPFLNCTGALWFNERFHSIIDSGLHSYDEQRRMWVDLSSRLPVSDYEEVTLLECKGSIMAITVEYKLPSVRVWELQMPTMEWFGAEIMTEDVFCKIQRSLDDCYNVSITSGDGNIFFMFLSYSLVYKRSLASWRLLDLSKFSYATSAMVVTFEPNFHAAV